MSTRIQKHPPVIGLNALWRMLSVLPAGEAVDVAVGAVLNRLEAPAHSVAGVTSVVPVAVSPRVLEGAQGAVDGLSQLWTAFTEPETAELAVELSSNPAQKLVTALNPAAAIPDKRTRRASSQVPVRALLPYIPDLLHHSPSSRTAAQCAYRTLKSARPGSMLKHTWSQYPFGQHPYALEAVPAEVIDRWMLATPEIYRTANPDQAVIKAERDHDRIIMATAGPDQVGEVLRILTGRTATKGQLWLCGGKLHENPWLRAVVLHEDFHDWGMLICDTGVKPIAGRILGEELLSRIAEDPGAWALALTLLMEWDGTLIDWLETVEGLA